MASPDRAMFDVVVWGAGPAGAASARMLAGSGHRVALLGFDSGHRRPTGESLPAAARPLLHRLGVWERFGAGPHLPCYGSESAWGSDHVHCTDALRDPHGHGWLLDRAAFDVALRAAAQAAGAALFSASAPAQVCPREAGLWRLGFRDGAGRPQSLAAPWLLDGTGRRSCLARLLGVRRVRYDGLVGHAAFRPDARLPSADAALTTLVEAGPEGWWYTAPMPGGARTVIYFTDADRPTGRQARSPDGFAALLRETRHVREWLGANVAVPMDGPWVACAHTARLERCSGDGWLAVGDAALSFDPLSAQGLFHALASGLDAAQAVEDALAGRASAPVDYERSRSAVFEAYQRHRAVFYAQERRWPDGAFWERRHRPTTPFQG